MTPIDQQSTLLSYLICANTSGAVDAQYTAGYLLNTSYTHQDHQAWLISDYQNHSLFIMIMNKQQIVKLAVTQQWGRGARVGTKLGKIGPKYDLSGTFKDQCQYILDRRAKMY